MTDDETAYFAFLGTRFDRPEIREAFMAGRASTLGTSSRYDKHETQDDPVVEIERIHRILDQHLPTIIFGLGELVAETYGKGRDNLTEREVSVRAAFSAAHWIAKDIVTPDSGEPLYDLPSVIDLMRTRKDSTRKTAVGTLADAARDVTFDGIPGLAAADSPADRERVVARWLDERALRVDREAMLNAATTTDERGR